MAGSNLRLLYRSLLTLSVQAKHAWATVAIARIYVQTLIVLPLSARFASCLLSSARRRRLAVARDNIARRETANRDAPGAAVCYASRVHWAAGLAWSNFSAHALAKW